jgi:hypothetical protein
MMKYLSARRKAIAIFCCALFLFQVVAPVASFALTSGPSQPEVQSFQAAGANDMVDLFSGDFSYNIPLFELPGPNGGYPFNLSYQSGIGMDQEASWVGLGWSLNPGAITRQMRGLPDEFRGDDIKTKMSIKPSITVGLSAGASVEVFGADGVSLKTGFSVSQNNNKGMGYSIDGSVGFAKAAGGGMTRGIGLDISLDSKEGVNLQPSLSLSGKIGEVGLGAGYNSKSGLSNISFFHSINYSMTGKGEKNYKGERKNKTVNTSFSGSSTLSLAHPGYTPQITMPMKNLNLSAEFKPGGSFWGIFANLYVRGFYNEQRLGKDRKIVTTDAFGYMNYQYAEDPTALLDFNREKDGMVMKESPNLGIPSLTYDVYSVTGQGIAAMYRPMRNDYGVIHDQQMSSESNGGALGVDVGPAASHIGVNLSINHSKSTSGPWTENNDFATDAAFQRKTLNDPYEPWYFKVHGETNIESSKHLADLGGDKAVRVELSGTSAQKRLLDNKTVGYDAPQNASINRERKNRNQVIQPITNEQLLNGVVEVLPEFRIKYVNEDGDTVNFIRDSSGKKHHIAGFTALTPEGLRYNYALPAYNHKQVEVTFSAQGEDPATGRTSVTTHGDEGDPKFEWEGTDEFLKSVELPPFTHSHLLTSILGPDYVDLTNNGVSDDDLGYWVKFTYRRTASAYKWRDPFSKAHYQRGWETDPRDDKGSFVYGQKEIWHLAKAETKSHIAVFEITTEGRLDGKGVLYKFQDNDETGPAVHKLQRIKLYSRLAGPNAPIKIVNFTYDNELCKGLYQGQPAAGKLTLKQLSFAYGGTTRGTLNPYKFEYSSTNPNYDANAYDRWGNYKPYPSGEFSHNRDFPYVPQDSLDKPSVDANASAWSLTKIQLPSGGKIALDYESDDYAYVQHLPAMQMMEVVDPASGSTETSTFNLSETRGPNLPASLVKVRFKLESGVSGTLTPEQQEAEVLKYLDVRRKQLYFKAKVNLRKAGENFHEYISGYATLEIRPKIPVNGVMRSTMGLETRPGDVSGQYAYGYFHVLTEEGNGNIYHPFSLRAWQHLRTNQPELASAGRKLSQTNDPGDRIDQIKSLGSVGTQIRQMFEGFYRYCDDKHWGREVIVGKSWIRLNSQGVKYGGGLRVRQVTMSDEWSEDKEGIYGQVYEYTMVEKGAIISSGVAANEPIVGGDENALRYAKKYVQSVPLRADNNLFFEYPVNESYYPGSQVGYRKVTVWSLASAYAANIAVKNVTLPNGRNLFPKGAGISYGTTGKTEHVFFTAKDFPVITDETDKANKPSKFSVPVPFLGNLAISKLITSQGYSIVTNDMHGKPKMVSNYRQDKLGNVEAEPISWVKYNYLSEERIYEQAKVNALVNTLKDNGDNTLSVASGVAQTKVTLGQETELFSDMRQYEDKAWSGGARFNTDIVYIPIAFVTVPIPVFVVWPSIGKTENLLRMSVTNKVIFKSGILESTEAYDGGSKMITRNVKWDKLTGTPMLTVTNNNFDAPIYNYSILANSQYEGMGAAFKNIGLTFSMSSVVKDPYKEGVYDFYSSMKGSLYPGDEIILFEDGAELNKPLAKAVYMGEIDGDNLIFTQQQLRAKNYQCMITRSGYRNQLSVNAGNITALDNDPSVPGTSVSYKKRITIVKPAQ